MPSNPTIHRVSNEQVWKGADSGSHSRRKNSKQVLRLEFSMLWAFAIGNSRHRIPGRQLR